MGLIETIGAVVMAVVAALFLGRRQGQKSERAKIDKAYRETREKMDEVVAGCVSAASDAALCGGTEAARREHAAALAADGGDRSVLTGARLIRLMDAGCN